jgi:hypothetical protein
MKTLILLGSLLLLSGCSSMGMKNNDMDYEASPCACLGDDVIFNGKAYKAKATKEV